VRDFEDSRRVGQAYAPPTPRAFTRSPGPTAPAIEQAKSMQLAAIKSRVSGNLARISGLSMVGMDEDVHHRNPCGESIGSGRKFVKQRSEEYLLDWEGWGVVGQAKGVLERGRPRLSSG
jgi:hypothetical protein